MTTRLTFADCLDPEWPSIGLPDYELSFREFWFTVLQFAMVNDAIAVIYRLDLGEDCLAVEVEDGVFPMVPPPEECRSEILVAARRLAGGGCLREVIFRLCQFILGNSCIGNIHIQSPRSDGDVLWRVNAVPSGVRFVRQAGPSQRSAVG